MNVHEVRGFTPRRPIYADIRHMIAKNLIALFLIVAVPIWDHFETKRLKNSTDPRVKIRSYKKTIGWLWSFSVLACIVFGWRAVLTIRRHAGEASWLPGPSFVIGFTGAAVVALFVPIIVMMRSETARARVAKSLERLNFILPGTAEERRWFVLVAITAGVCEEILYRGFLIQYFREQPVHLGLVQALVLSACVFGIAHLYQGIIGIVQTAILGALFGVLFVTTGSLVLPMILHALIDLRILLILRERSGELSTSTNVTQ
jgi:membrane protease YdiL (CAAX protease family)